MPVLSDIRVPVLPAHDTNTLFIRAETFNWVPSCSLVQTTGGVEAEILAAFQVLVTCVEQYKQIPSETAHIIHQAQI
jgi:hypothetical protein